VYSLYLAALCLIPTLGTLVNLIKVSNWKRPAAEVIRDFKIGISEMPFIVLLMCVVGIIVIVVLVIDWCKKD